MHADAHLRNFGDDRFDRLLNAALEFHRVRPGGDVLQPFAIDRLGQNGRGGRAVAGDVVGLAGDFLDHLGAHVRIRALQFDLLRDGHAVLRDGGGAEFLVDDDIAALRTERRLDRLAQQSHAFENPATGLFRKNKLFSHNTG